LPDRTAEFSEAMWELEATFGLGLTVPEQVAVARDLGTRDASMVTSSAVAAAFRSRGLKPPSKRYTDALVSRVGTLAPRRSLTDVLVSYRARAIRDLSRQFGDRKATGHEDELRRNLLTYLPERGYVEAHTGRGQTDILLPNPTRIIECKVWTTVGVYEDGMTELERYIETEGAEGAWMVVFGDREPLPSIISDHTKAIAEERTLAGIVVPVVVVPFEVDQPSRAGVNARRRARAGR
jgi:hypothetical protein